MLSNKKRINWVCVRTNHSFCYHKRSYFNVYLREKWIGYSMYESEESVWERKRVKSEQESQGRFFRMSCHSRPLFPSILPTNFSLLLQVTFSLSLCCWFLLLFQFLSLSLSPVIRKGAENNSRTSRCLLFPVNSILQIDVLIDSHGLWFLFLFHLSLSSLPFSSSLAFLLLISCVSFLLNHWINTEVEGNSWRKWRCANWNEEETSLISKLLKFSSNVIFFIPLSLSLSTFATENSSTYLVKEKRIECELFVVTTSRDVADSESSSERGRERGVRERARKKLSVSYLPIFSLPTLMTQSI